MTENGNRETYSKCIQDAYRAPFPGLLESVYEAALAYELRSAGLKRWKRGAYSNCPAFVALDEAFRADLIVGGKVID